MRPGLTDRFDLDRPMVRHGVAAALAAVALLLRFWGIDTQPLWFDEAMTTHIVHEPDGLDFVHNTPPLYYWLLRGWTGWFGIGATGLRSLSAVAGAAFVWVTFHAARAGIGNRAALAAALLVSVSPIHLYYSQEARAYSLLLFELMLASWMLWRLVAKVQFGSWLGLVLASTAALYTHYLALLPLGLGYLVIGLSAPAPMRRSVGRALASAAVLAVAALVPWLAWWSKRTPFEPSDMRWLALLWSQLSGAGAFASSFELLLLGGEEGRTPIFLKQFTRMPFPCAARVVAEVVAVVLLMAILLRVRYVTLAVRQVTIQCFVLFLGPLLGLWLLSFVNPVYCPGRYDLIAFPGFVLLLGLAMSRALAARSVATRLLAGLGITAVALVIGAKDLRYFAAPPATDPTGAIALHLEANVQPEETVVLCGTIGLPVLAHMYQDGFVWSEHTCRSARRHVEFGCRLLPPALETAPATASRYLRTLEDGSLATEFERMLASMPPTGVWLVLGEELRTNGRNVAMDAIAHRLFDVLHIHGYAVVDSDSSLGVAHLLRRSGH